jgi:hypothetical protein
MFENLPGVMNVLLDEDPVLVVRIDVKHVLKVDPSQALCSVHGRAAGLDGGRLVLWHGQNVLKVVEGV